jgi:hypothetical protein
MPRDCGAFVFPVAASRNGAALELPISAYHRGRVGPFFRRYYMPRFVKVGSDVFDVDAITLVTYMENRSGISDRILITLTEGSVTVDSGIVGRDVMEGVWKRLMDALKPADWDGKGES